MLKRLLRLLMLAAICCSALAADELSRTIDRVKPSVVGIGSYQKTRSPALSFIGSGFVIDDGLTIVTAAHVIYALRQRDTDAAIGILIRQGDTAQFRPATVTMLDKTHDLARLKVDGMPLPALKLAYPDNVAEGKALAFMGFPLGMALGLRQVTHRCIVSAITPVVMPALGSSKLNAKVLSQLQHSAYLVYQLDGTAYPGHSGSPLFDPETGQVVGVINMIFVQGVKEPAAPSGIAYAVPIGLLAPAVQP